MRGSRLQYSLPNVSGAGTANAMTQKTAYGFMDLTASLLTLNIYDCSVCHSTAVKHGCTSDRLGIPPPPHASSLPL